MTGATLLRFASGRATLHPMADALDQERISAAADETIDKILLAAASWAAEAPPALTPAIRAVCVRLAEMVADQRHYLARQIAPGDGVVSLQRFKPGQMVLFAVGQRFHKLPGRQIAGSDVANLALVDQVIQSA